ncbi:MAG: DUF3365 domain-containing protein [Desulfobacteraceae bacterium]|nr:DUF3365 domain-containing protein [Desulfobacteraceae bacterium]
MQNEENQILPYHKKSSPKMNYPLKQKFVLGVIIIIVPILGLLFTWIGFRISNQGKQETLEKARVIADQIVLTRQWITDCMGGVFVNIESEGSKGVPFVIKEQISSPSDTYQFFTPSMVTQKLSQYSFEKKSYQFRLSSLTPINIANSPNSFEKTALKSFQTNKTKEYFQFKDQSFNYMVPLYTKKGCIKCHTREKKQKTSIIGGLRVTIPYGNIKHSLEDNIWLLAGAGICITFVTIIVLVFLIHRLVLKPINELEEKSRQLSTGKLNTRVSLHTNDELEKLGKSFNLMAENLMHNRENLEEKVTRATKDLAQANHELLKLDKLKSDFLTNMSHELRTPLTAVKGSINYLERTLNDPENLEYIHIIEKNISRLTRLISNLFDFTKLEAGKIDWEFEREDISQLVREVIDIMSPLAHEKNLTVLQNLPEHLYAVIDLERMEQVLVNLLDNAIKFSETNATIKIQVEAKSSNIQISIKDQGPGIAKENLETIFKKFYTATTDSTMKNQGAGMGLAISKAIVTAHDGSINVQSSKGSPSTFFIKLPKG